MKNDAFPFEKFNTSQKIKYVTFNELYELAKQLDDLQFEKDLVIVDAKKRNVTKVYSYIFAVDDTGYLVAINSDCFAFFISGLAIATKYGEVIIDNIPFANVE